VCLFICKWKTEHAFYVYRHFDLCCLHRSDSVFEEFPLHIISISDKFCCLATVFMITPYLLSDVSDFVFGAVNNKKSETCVPHKSRHCWVFCYVVRSAGYEWIQTCTRGCEDWTWAREGKESPLLETVAREPLMKTQQAGGGLSGCCDDF
jgi:hypothetical protein